MFTKFCALFINCAKLFIFHGLIYAEWPVAWGSRKLFWAYNCKKEESSGEPAMLYKNSIE
uniref:Uncharacterized protein n=1 Tax=Rhizophora mucronata TaxID=61149 RepID=A0A2P2PQ78_RHIMU